MLLTSLPRPRRAAPPEATTASATPASSRFESRFESPATRITELFGDVGDAPRGEPTAAAAHVTATTDLAGGTDEALVAAHRSGVTGAFELLVDRHRDELFAFLLRFVRDEATAEDLVQDAFLRVHRHAGQFDAGRAFRPWLYSIAANGARDVIRTRRRRGAASLQAPLRSRDGDAGTLGHLLAADAAAPSGRLEAAEIGERVRAVLAAMPKHLRQILQLSYFQQFDYSELSQALDIPIGTVKSRLNAAVAYFARRWQDKHHACGYGPRRQARARRRSPNRPPAPTASSAAAVAA
jgi:RNA polymerase sigma-70 factor (ECF subfamily)